MITSPVTRRDRRISQQAESLGRAIVKAAGCRCCKGGRTHKCPGLIHGHEVLVAEPHEVMAGRPLVSINLYRLDASFHASNPDALRDELASQVRSQGRRSRNGKRELLMSLADRIERI